MDDVHIFAKMSGTLAWALPGRDVLMIGRCWRETDAHTDILNALSLGLFAA